MPRSIIDISRDFFQQVVKPILAEHHPQVLERTAFGVFGYGSEVLRLDDEYSRDHHWGVRINALMPDELFAGREAVLDTLQANLPETFQGHSLREGFVAGAAIEPDSLHSYLGRTIGLDHAPETYEEWLRIPEEDIVHVVNGEVWHDPSGEFTALREHFQGYYPEPVRLRRIAHWCRYFSGMGAYALKRALLRENEYYANIAFSRALRLGVQLAFLLDRQYAPYDKWTMAFFKKLPRMADPMLPLVEEATSLSTPWERKLELLHQISDVLDETMVADGIIPAHPRFAVSPTSGYRLLEHAYAEIIKQLPEEIRPIVPVWDQIHLESFHSGYVASLEIENWDALLNLKPIEEGEEERA